MDARVVAFVAARLLAMYLVLGNALVAATVMVMTAVGGPDGYRGISAASSAIAMLINLAAGITVWMRSRWISDRVAGGLKAVHLGDLGPDRWKALSVALVGALSLMTALRIAAQSSLWLKVLSGQIALWKVQPSPLDAIMPLHMALLPILLEAAFFLVFGILMIACQNTIVRMINGIGDWANKPFIDERAS